MSEYLEFVGSALWSKHIRVKVGGNYAYLAMTNGLRILDVSDLENPILAAELYLPGGPFLDIVVRDNLVYMAGNERVIYRIDVSDDGRPNITGTFTISDWVNSMDVSGDYACVSYGRGFTGEGRGVMILAVDGNEIEAVGDCPLEVVPDKVRIAGDFAYVGGLSLTVINISDPYNPAVVSSTPGDGDKMPVWVEVRDTLAYVCANDVMWPPVESALDVYNVKDPANPVFIAGQPFPDNINWLVISGNLGFVSNGFWGVKIVDVTDPENLKLIGSYLNPGDMAGIAVSDTILFACDLRTSATYKASMAPKVLHPDDAEPGDFLIIDVSDPTTPQFTSAYHTPKPVTRVITNADIAYCLNDAWDGPDVQIVDISDPAAPDSIGCYTTDRGAGIGGFVSGSYLYLTVGSEGLEIVDVSDPGNPALIGICADGSEALDVVVSGAYAFVANGAAGLGVWDVSSPESPDFIGAFAVSGTAVSIAQYGDYIYIAADDLNIFDVSAPENPHLVSTLTECESCQEVVLGNDRLYVETLTGFCIFDVEADPENPPLLNSIIIDGGSQGLAYYNDLILMACGGEGVGIFDVSDPYAAHQVGLFNTPGNPAGVAVNDSMVYIADTESLIVTKLPTILDVDDEDNQTPGIFVLRQNYPNPFNPETIIEYTVPSRSVVTLTVLNVLGQSVCTLVDGVRQAGVYAARWDGRDSGGERLASGVYFYRITIGEFTETREMVLLK